MDQNEITILQTASRDAIANSLSRIQSTSNWLDIKRNRYSRRIEKIGTPSFDQGRINKPDLIEYISSSIFIHYQDSWGFFGQAMQAYLQGRQHAALHLAYYSELRSAMALLASEGVGIFNYKHYGVDINGNCAILNSKGTHTALWEIFEEWAKMDKARELLLKIIKPASYSLEEWCTELGLIHIVRNSVAYDLLLSWGLDLRNMHSDKEARNFASYRPSSFVLPKQKPFKNILEYLISIWKFFEPKATSYYHNVDFQILHRSLMLSMPEIRSHSINTKNYSSSEKLKIINTADQFGRTELEKSKLKEFLLNTDDKSHFFILDKAAGTLNVHQPGGIDEVFARTFLLLKLCSGSLKETIKRANLSKEHLSFWLTDFHENFGICSPSSDIQNYSDLWADYSPILEDTHDWLMNNPTSNTRHRFMTQKPDIFLQLCKTEAVALWELGL
jgi:hypothetical protein